MNTLNTRIIDAIGHIDDKFINEVLDMNDTLDNNTKSKSRKPLFIGGACTIAAAVIAGVFIFRSGMIGQNGILETPSPYSEFAIDYDNLPFEYTAPDELSKITSGLYGGAMGFEGFTADDISDYAERNSHNPWNPSLEINELPVFTTRYGAYASMVSATIDKDEAMTKLEEIAAALGGELSDIELDEVQLDHYDPTYADELEGKLLSAKAKVGDIRITIFDLGSVHVEFGSALQLPDGYGFDNDDPDPEKQAGTAMYIIDKYPELFGLKTPITYTDFYQYAYDYSDNAFDAILNYNFSQLRFYENDDEVGVWMDDILADYKCEGFYPVITPEKAREELLAGNYVTTVPEDPYLPDGVTEDNTEDFCELAYRQNSVRSAYIPYYRFIVRLHDEINDGNHYGVVYVPAVEPEYLESAGTDLKFDLKFN